MMRIGRLIALVSTCVIFPIWEIFAQSNWTRKMQPFNEVLFKQRVYKALEVTRTVLDVTKHPKLPSEQFHKYEDKYTLAESLVTVAVAAHLNCLEAVGLTNQLLAQLKSWVQQDKSSVTLRLKAEETCEFLRKEERKVESDSHVSEVRVCT